MDAIRFGRAVRVLRLRRQLTQTQLGARCRMSRSQISRIETGRVDRIRIGDLQRLAIALDARFEPMLSWRGAGLDRLIDEAHTTLVDSIVAWLTGRGWEVAVEVSFAVFGERGSVDVFARHPSGALLVVEAKASIGDANQTLIGLDRKIRLAPEIAKQRGWPRGPTGALLIVSESTTSRNRIARHATSFRQALPAPSLECRRWVRQPVGAPPRGIVFLGSQDSLARNASRAFATR
jgi:transcriptional regulator with XRE-family HTH domain